VGEREQGGEGARVWVLTWGAWVRCGEV
jgi:hypothetical protein